MLRERATRYAERTAVLATSCPPITYAELFRSAEDTLVQLSALGISRGDCVAVVLPDGPDFIRIFLALAAMGATCAPLNPAYREDEFDFYLSDLKPELLIADDATPSAAVRAAQKRGLRFVSSTMRWDETSAAGVRRGPPCEQPTITGARADDVLLLLHTSGTTAKPKKVPLAQSNVCHSALNIATSLALSPLDRSLNVMPLFHVHGLIGSVLSSLAAGGSVVCPGAFRGPQFLDWLDEFSPTWYTAVPSIHQTVLSRITRDRDESRQHTLRFIRSCSAPLPPRVMEALEQAFKVPVIEAYGMTEGSHQIACNPLPPCARKAGSVGIATGTTIAIVDDRGNPLPAGSTGEVVIRGAGVMRGYSGAQESHDDAFADGWFRTGDLGYIDGDGYLFLTARKKEVINRGGEKISPREIDDVLAAHPAVLHAAAFAVPDARLGEDVAAAVVLRENGTASEEELRAFVAGRLAAFKVPRRLVIVPELPKGPTGKLQRTALAERLGLGDVDVASKRPAFIAPRDKLERLLATIWQQVLRVDKIGVHDNFFDLGGDSLSAVELALQLEHVLRIQLSVGGLLQAPSIEQLANAIAKGDASLRHPRISVIQPGTGSKLPFFCVDAGPMFRNLAARLGADQPFMSLYCPDAAALPVPYRVADLAAYHVETMRHVQPRGPYRVGGWCNSGLIAYEVAQQLRAQGEDVELLALFDTVNPGEAFSELPPGAPRDSAEDIQSVRTGLRKLRSRFAAREAASTFSWILHRARMRALETWYDVCVRLHIPLSLGLRDMEVIARLATRAYRVRPYPGRVVLVRRSRRLGELSEQLGWAGWAVGGVDVYAIPGDHADMFREPQVRHTAAVLSHYLGQAEATRAHRNEADARDARR